VVGGCCYNAPTTIATAAAAAANMSMAGDPGSCQTCTSTDDDNDDCMLTNCMGGLRARVCLDNDFKCHLVHEILVLTQQYSSRPTRACVYESQSICV